MAWMAVTRFATFRKMGITLDNIPPGSRGVNLEGRAPDEVQWKAHNYMHLMEQPTIFYALVFAIVLANLTDQFFIELAWAYVALRVVHTLVQCTVNNVTLRFSVFVLSTVVLMVMAGRAIAML
jgi:hypothetical protein